MDYLWPIAQFLYNADDYLVFRDVFRCLSLPQRDYLSRVLFSVHNVQINDFVTTVSNSIDPVFTELATWELIMAHVLVYGSWATHYKAALLLTPDDRAKIKQLLIEQNTDASLKALDKLSMCEIIAQFRYATPVNTLSRSATIA
jgi:hypothetical protein